ncbi:MAG TPA: hypothetical protein VJH87_09500 [Vicinamibacteria bacterium]|nr:hypothetical protein [Vicinamibacteria bacterium]
MPTRLLALLGTEIAQLARKRRKAAKARSPSDARATGSQALVSTPAL